MLWRSRRPDCCCCRCSRGLLALLCLAVAAWMEMSFVSCVCPHRSSWLRGGTLAPRGGCSEKAPDKRGAWKTGVEARSKDCTETRPHLGARGTRFCLAGTTSDESLATRMIARSHATSVRFQATPAPDKVLNDPPGAGGARARRHTEKAKSHFCRLPRVQRFGMPSSGGWCACRPRDPT